MRRRRGAIVVVSIALASTPALADPAASRSNAVVIDAQSHFHRGLELYDEGNLAAAVAEMKRAYQLAPNYRVLYNIGQIQFEMQNYAAAVAAFEAYLDGAGKEVPVERRRLVEKDVAKLKQRLASIEIVVNVPRAEIWVDDELVGTAPLAAPLVVNAGRRKIMAIRAGYSTAQRLIELAGGDASKVAIDLVEEKPAPTPLPPAPAPAPVVEPKKLEPAPVKAIVHIAPVERKSSDMWMGWVATGALAAGSGTLAVLAWQASIDLKNERNHLGATGDSLREKSEKVRNLALAADLGFVATAMTGTAMVVLAVSSNRRPPPDAARVEVTVSPSEIAFRGTF